MKNPNFKISPDDCIPYLKHIEIFRYLQTASPEYGSTLCYPYRDETRKITVAKYRLIKILYHHIEDLKNWVYRLDARSIRYMRRVSIIENRPFKGAK